jgi:hypothetical protein
LRVHHAPGQGVLGVVDRHVEELDRDPRRRRFVLVDGILILCRLAQITLGPLKHLSDRLERDF